MTDEPLLYIPSMWDDLGTLLWDPVFWAFFVVLVIGFAVVVRISKRRRARWY